MAFGKLPSIEHAMSGLTAAMEELMIVQTNAQEVAKSKSAEAAEARMAAKAAMEEEAKAAKIEAKIKELIE